MTVKHDSPEQQALIGKLTIVNIVLIDLSVTIIEQTMNANHQYTTFIINETCNRAIRRIKLFDFSIRCSVSNRTAMSGFPEVAFLIDKDITEVIEVAFGIALYQLCMLVGNIQTVESISCRSYEQVVFVFLDDVIHSRNIFGTV